jgi:hypothetical protein
MSLFSSLASPSIFHPLFLAACGSSAVQLGWSPCPAGYWVILLLNHSRWGHGKVDPHLPATIICFACSCRASVQYRQAFERELEEDEFDRLAAGNSNPDEARPLRSMKVRGTPGGGAPGCRTGQPGQFE